MDGGWKQMFSIMILSILITIVFLLAQSPNSDTKINFLSIDRVLSSSDSDDSQNQNKEEENWGDIKTKFDPNKQPDKGILKPQDGKKLGYRQREVQFAAGTKFGDKQTSTDVVDGANIDKGKQPKSYWPALMCPTFEGYGKKVIYETTVLYFNGLALRRTKQLQKQGNEQIKQIYDTLKANPNFIKQLRLEWNLNLKKELNTIVSTVLGKMAKSPYAFFQVSEQYDLKFDDFSRLKAIQLIQEELYKEASKVNEMVDFMLLFDKRIKVKKVNPLNEYFWQSNEWGKSNSKRDLVESIPVSKIAIADLLRELGNPPINEQLITLMKQAFQQRIISDSYFRLHNLRNLRKERSEERGNADNAGQSQLMRYFEEPTPFQALKWAEQPELSEIFHKMEQEIKKSGLKESLRDILKKQEPQRVKRLSQRLKYVQGKERRKKNLQQRKNLKKEEQEKKKEIQPEQSKTQKEKELEKFGWRARLQQKKEKQEQEKRRKAEEQQRIKQIMSKMPKGCDDPETEEDQALYPLP